jgi:hypothetical protein
MTSIITNMFSRVVINPRILFFFLRFVLIVLIVLLAFASIISMFSDISMTVVEQIPVIENEENTAASSGKSLAEYKAILNYDNIFSTIDRTAHKPTANPIQNKNLEALLSNYDIQGTIRGDSPKVIIYDKKAKSTISIGIGEKIGQIEVTAINRDHISFQLLGESHDVKY